MSDRRRWRIGADVRSPDVGAAAVFEAVVDWDDPSGLLPGHVDVLSSFVWQEGCDTRWWLGTVVEARSAGEAARLAANAIAERTKRIRTTVAGVQAVGSLGAEADEEADADAVPSLRHPVVVPVAASACARRDDRLTISWSSGLAPLAFVTTTVTESLVIGIFEQRPPVTGPESEGELLVRRERHVVVRLDENVPASHPMLDRYSGEYLPEGPDLSGREDAIEPRVCSM